METSPTLYARLRSKVIHVLEVVAPTYLAFYVLLYEEVAELMVDPETEEQRITYEHALQTHEVYLQQLGLERLHGKDDPSQPKRLDWAEDRRMKPTVIVMILWVFTYISQ